ncbi:MAG: methyltransferase [Acidimicrobiales bacterium]
MASAGIEAILAGPASALPRAVDLSAHRRLLDVGGGTGSWSIAPARAYPNLHSTVVDLPVVVGMARERVAAAALGDRVDVVAGDAMAGELPSGHDAFLLANFVHYWSPEENRALLARLRRTATPGARLLLADFWTDATHTQPVHAALMAGEWSPISPSRHPTFPACDGLRTPSRSAVRVCSWPDHSTTTAGKPPVPRVTGWAESGGDDGDDDHRHRSGEG